MQQVSQANTAVRTPCCPPISASSSKRTPARASATCAPSPPSCAAASLRRAASARASAASRGGGVSVASAAMSSMASRSVAAAAFSALQEGSTSPCAAAVARCAATSISAPVAPACGSSYTGSTVARSRRRCGVSACPLGLWAAAGARASGVALRAQSALLRDERSESGVGARGAHAAAAREAPLAGRHCLAAERPFALTKYSVTGRWAGLSAQRRRQLWLTKSNVLPRCKRPELAISPPKCGGERCTRGLVRTRRALAAAPARQDASNS